MFIAWKRAGRAVLKLRVPSSAKRVSSLIGRKCRVSEAKVVLAFVDGEEQRGGGAFVSERGGRYFVGETTKSDSFDDDIRVDCTNGIHVFVTRAEAESW